MLIPVPNVDLRILCVTTTFCVRTDLTELDRDLLPDVQSYYAMAFLAPSGLLMNVYHSKILKAS